MTEPAARPYQRRRRRVPVLLEIAFAIAVVVLVQAFVAKPFVVPSQSMENTLHVSDRIVVNRMDHTVHRFDVVVFSHGNTWADKRLPEASTPVERVIRDTGDVVGILFPTNYQYTVKRVIGLPGDRVGCCSADGRVQVGGSPITEPYVHEDLRFTPGALDCTTTPRSTRCFPDITVPQGSYLVMGDHRSQSSDSVIGCRGSPNGPECARFVPRERIVGPVVFRIWPVSRIGGIPR